MVAHTTYNLHDSKMEYSSLQCLLGIASCHSAELESYVFPSAQPQEWPHDSDGHALCCRRGRCPQVEVVLEVILSGLDLSKPTSTATARYSVITSWIVWGNNRQQQKILSTKLYARLFLWHLTQTLCPFQLWSLLLVWHKGEAFYFQLFEHSLWSKSPKLDEVEWLMECALIIRNFKT